MLDGFLPMAEQMCYNGGILIVTLLANRKKEQI